MSGSLHIDASFQNVDALKLDRFFGENQKDLRNTTIKVGDHSFRVSFAEDGKVSVSFATTSFLHLFQGSAKTAVKNKIQELVDLYKLKSGLVNVTMRTAQDAIVNQAIHREILPMVNAQSRDVVHYGFSTVRTNAQREINTISKNEMSKGNSGFNSFLVNDLNVTVGLAGDSGAKEMIAFMLKNKTGLVEDDFKPRGNIDPKLSADWAKFLQGRDVDIFSKINLAIEEAKTGKKTGWAGEINKNGLENTVVQMVKKNIDPRFLANVQDANELLLPVARAIIEAKDVDFSHLEGCDVRSEKYTMKINAKLNEILLKHLGKDSGKSEQAFAMLDNVFTSAFWRQTSKLGLDFFKSRGIPVVFEWTKYNGEKTDESELGDKWWKDSGSDIYKHFGVAITNSEMRHLKSDKYLAKEGANRIVRIQGNASQAKVSAEIDRSMDALAKIPPKELRRIHDNLKASFRDLKAEQFHAPCIKLIKTLPAYGELSFCDGDGVLFHEGKVAIENALKRVLDKINSTQSVLVKTATMMNIGQAVEAELLQDPAVVELLENYGEDEMDRREPLSEEAKLTRTLHGVENGKGHEIFFDKSGKTNILGSLVLDAAKKNSSVESVVKNLSNELSVRLGIEDALSNPIVRPFLMRAANGAPDLDYLLDRSLDSIKRAYDAKIALTSKVNELLANKSDNVKALFRRRGDWDLNRIIYKETARNEATKAVIEKLRHRAEVLLTICEKADGFVAAMENELKTTFTEKERDRLVDSYLDRPNSQVCTYRLDGSDEAEANLDGDDAACHKRYKEVAQRILAHGEELSQAERNSLLAESISSNSKPLHVEMAINLLKTVKTAGIESLAGKPRTSENIVGFLRMMSEKMEAPWKGLLENYYKTHDEVVDALGSDDYNSIANMVLTAYLKNDADTSALLEAAAQDEDVVIALQEMLTDLGATLQTTILKALISAASRYNQMT